MSKYNYSVVEKGAKIGVHGIRSNEILAFTRMLVQGGAHFPVVKAVDDMGWIADVKAASPDTITIGRFTSSIEGCGNVEDTNVDLESMAKNLVNIIIHRASTSARLNVDYWEICNEPDPPGAEGYRQLARLMIECMEYAERYDLKLALFGLNAGTPEWDEMNAMAETGVFARAKEGGHILTLHEGTFDTFDPLKCYGDTIPGSPVLEGKVGGCLNLRYRYLYHILEQRDEVIPLVISEFYCGNEQDATIATLESALRTLDAEYSRDYYVIGSCPFTLGPTSGWSHTDWERVYPGTVNYMIAVRDMENVLPKSEDAEDTLDYTRHYGLLPPIESDLDRLLWRSCMAVATSYEWQTLGHSAHDAAYPGARVRNVTAINPDQWPSDLKDWLDENFPPLDGYGTIYADTPYEAAIKVQDILLDHINLSQQDPRWADWDFGEAHGDTGTIKKAGCYLTSLTMLFRDLLGFDVLPTVLDMLLRIAQAVYVEDNLVHLDAIPDLFPLWFDKANKINNTLSVSTLCDMMDAGWKIILPRADYGHFVYLIDADPTNRMLTIIDPSDGETKKVEQQWAGGARALHVNEDLYPPSPQEYLLGLHDASGGERMLAEGCTGYCLVNEVVQEHPVGVDYTRMYENGILPILRLNWGYAHGNGTLPPPDKYTAFVDAVTQTINWAEGIHAVHIGNEPNNVSEHPPGYTLTPEYVTTMYNDIAIGVRDDVLLGPPPIDPYFGPGSDNSVWWKHLLNNSGRIDVLFLHTLKTQTNDPMLAWSREMFSDEPLTWQYLNAYATLTYLNMIPGTAEVPIIVTEANPQHKYNIGGELGWVPDNDGWVHEIMNFVTDLNSWAPRQIGGIIFYRYERAGGGQEGFALEDKPTILQTILHQCENL